MLQLKNIVKDYETAGTKVRALDGISLRFRRHEFVSILGASGCGKTTLLNLIGGLDHYTDGDLVIKGTSTKDYSARDWDTYRNHSIGFVFQSYNLIPHQTVLANVELALTLSGVSKAERRQRAKAALERVGLGDQLHKKPNQMSGGQMQRVAIARALVNDPEILLADEPTGALDSVTSVQIMEILKEISHDKLIIMVTHNPELAEQYSSRIVRLSDGKVIGDTAPYDGTEAEPETADAPAEKEPEGAKDEKIGRRKKHSSMSFFTALSLSLNNLMTKKARTFLTSFAGSIGIIGIALILSVSTGVQAYIDGIERSTMSSYPLTIESTSVDLVSMLSTFSEKEDVMPEEGHVGTNDMFLTMVTSVSSMLAENNLEKFKAHLDSKQDEIGKYVNEIRYLYNVNMNIYRQDGDEYIKTMSYGDLLEQLTGTGGGSNAQTSMLGDYISVFSRLIDDPAYVESQYDIVDGTYPTGENEIAIVVDGDHRISDFVLYSLGLIDVDELADYAVAMQKYKADPENVEKPEKPASLSPDYTFEELRQMTFKVLPDAAYYTVNENEKIERLSTEGVNNLLKDDATRTLKVVGILTAAESAVSADSVGGIVYTGKLMDALIADNNNSDVVKLQYENKTTNLLINAQTNPDGELAFIEGFTKDDPTFLAVFMLLNMSDEQQAALLAMTPEERLAIPDFTLAAMGFPLEQKPILAMLDPYAPMVGQLKPVLGTLGYAIDNKDDVLRFINKYVASGWEAAIGALGYVNLEKPDAIHIYPKDFDSKDVITKMISDYNDAQTDESDKITYADTVGLLMSSISTIVNAISYVLIGFVAISLVVSSIMIGIITYISVLERTKEIGILRAIGASKRDISRVFNAETLIVGFGAGLIGVLAALLLNIVINIILHALTGLATLSAVLPLGGAIALVIISMALTLIAGLFPSRIAAKKDPVVALRTE